VSSAHNFFFDILHALKHENMEVRTMKITTKLRDLKDCFEVTIYKEIRKNINIFIGDIVILDLNGSEIIRPVKADFHVSLPKRFLPNKSHFDEINLLIKGIHKAKSCLERTTRRTSKQNLDIRSCVPSNTIFERPLYLIERENNSSTVWYPHGSKLKPITIKNFVDINKIAELMGFYFGDGTTCQGIRSFRLTNCEPSVLNYCLDVLEELGMGKTSVKFR
tara:strand:- start:6695 stop:7354 length:660 start_codon:yes stop_codon:yes gene_type:complete